MATEAIKRLRYVYSVEGADKVVAANDKVAKSQEELEQTVADLERRYNALIRAQQAQVAANATAGASISAANDNYAGFGKTLLDTASGFVSSVAHLKLIAAAAYALSPAFRSFTNSAITGGIGQLGAAFPTIATGAEKVLSVLSPALQFFTRLSVPIGAAVAAFTALNAVWQTGADLLDKYANRQRELFGTNVDADLAKLTKFQDPVPLDVINRATELGSRLQTAKDTLAEFAKVQLDLNDPALKLQSVWVTIVETIAKGVGLLPALGDGMASLAQKFGNLPIWKIFSTGGDQSAIIDRINTQNGTSAQTQESQLAARARGITLLSQAMKGGASFAERFSNAITDLAADPKKVEGVKQLTGEFERLAASIERHIAVTEADAQTQGKSAGEVERLRTEFRLVEAAQQDIIKNGGSIDDYAARIKSLADRAGEAAQKVASIREAGAAIGEFANTFVQAMLRGETAAKAFGAALKNIGTSLASGAFKQLGAQISTSLSGLLGGAGSLLGSVGGPLGTAALGIGASLLGSLFGDDKAEQEAAAKAATDAMNQANDALKSVTASFMTFTAAADGAVTSVIKNGQQQFTQLKQAADAALAAANTIVNTPGNTPAAMAAANQSRDLANASVINATARLAEFNERTIETGRESLRGAAALSQVEQALKDLDDKAKDLQEAMVLVGTNAEDAAAAIADDLAIALGRLTEQISDDLTRSIYDLTDQGYLNEVADLLEKVADASKLSGVNPALIGEFFQVSAQKIVDSAKLTGHAFEVLVQDFPALAGVVHEFSETAVADAEAITSAADAAAAAADAAAAAADAAAAAAAAAMQRVAGFVDRLLAAQVDSSTLAGRLAIFDRAAEREREQEAKEAIPQLATLELTLAAERARIIDDFAKQALEAEQRSAEERIAAINGAAKSVVDYVNSLFVTEVGGLSPRNRLAAAQSTYAATLARAQTGDIAAVNRIAEDAEAYRKGLRDVYGSTQQYQLGLKQITTDLLNLPTVQSSTDQIVNAIRDSIIVLQHINAQLGGGPVVVESNRVDGLASGGWVSGGVEGRDSVPMLAMPGEFVVNSAVARANAAWLPMFNRTGAAGGGNGGGGETAGEVRASRRENAVMLSQIAKLIAQGNADNVTAIKDQQRSVNAETRAQADRTQARQRTRTGNV